jgi:hypothetical protein
MKILTLLSILEIYCFFDNNVDLTSKLHDKHR